MPGSWGPSGALPDAADRRRLLVDLLDDALLPLGSAIVTGEVRADARVAATMRVTSDLQQHDLELAPNALRLVDLPPGVPARVEVEMREGQVLGVRGRRIALDVTGGLGGLLVDTREVPLRLPERCRAASGAAGGLGAPGVGCRRMTLTRHEQLGRSASGGPPRGRRRAARPDAPGATPASTRRPGAGAARGAGHGRPAGHDPGAGDAAAGAAAAG